MIETERLLLRMPRPDDAPGLLEAFADPEAMRYIGNGSTRTLADAEAALARWLEQWQAWDVGRLVVERRDDGRMLGRAGFIRWNPDTAEMGGPETEIGWALAREHWGRGYATEAALALRDWAISARGFTRLISTIQVGNVASVRVAEKIGETFEREVMVKSTPSLIYSMEL